MGTGDIVSRSELKEMSMYNGVNVKTVMAYIVTVCHQGLLVLHVFLN